MLKDGLEKYLKNNEHRISEDFGIEYFILEYLSSTGEFSDADEEYLEQIGYGDPDYFYEDELMQ